MTPSNFDLDLAADYPEGCDWCVSRFSDRRGDCEGCDLNEWDDDEPKTKGDYDHAKD